MALPDLPADFVAFLESHAGKQAYEFEGVEWWVATEKELSKTIDVDSHKMPYVNQPRGICAKHCRVLRRRRDDGR